MNIALLLYLKSILTATLRDLIQQPQSKRPKIGFQDQLSLNAGQKYCSKHSAILLTSIKLPVVIKIFVLSIFEWLFYTGFTVLLFVCRILKALLNELVEKSVLGKHPKLMLRR